MNKTNKTRQHQVTRREFVGGALAAAGVLTGAPALLRGRNLNDKLNIAFIACGGRAIDNIDELTITARRRGRPSAAAAPGRGGAGATVRHRIPTRTSSFSAT